MLVRFLMLALVVSVAAAFAMPEIPQQRALSSALLATAVLATAIFASSSAIASLVRRSGLVLILILAVPAIYMAVQLAPVPVHGLGNPIWETASAALNAPLAERLTVDVRATVQAFLHYSTAVALALITTVVALDRQRAWQLLSMLVAISTIVSAYLLLRQTIGADGFSRGDTPVLAATGAVPAVLGLVLSAAMMTRAFEDRRRVKQRPFRVATTPWFALLATLLCLSAILASGDGMGTATAALLGVGIVLAAFAIRNWFSGVWGIASVLATAAVLFLAAFTLMPIRPNADLTVALSEHPPGATERMLQDAGHAGSGAGTYAALLPIHRDIAAPLSRERPTAAAAIAIEMGRPFLYGVLIVAVVGAGALLRCSLRRRHDYVYAAIGAGAATSLVVLALVEDGILEFGASLLAAALFGLAVAQSQRDTGAVTEQSRSARPVVGLDSPGPACAPIRSYGIGNASMRVGLGTIAVALIAQTVWLLAQPSYPGGLPVEALVPNDASRQALLRVLPQNSLRSDGDLRSGRPAAAPQPAANGAAASRPEFGVHPAAPTVLAQALRSSPLRGDLWLMLAALSREQRSVEYDVAALLKLSYYTAPNDLALLPLRLTAALGEASVVSDPELRELVQRDAKIAFARQPALRPALIAAYQSASAEGKALVDNLISEWDSAALQSMRKEGPIPGPKADPPLPSRTWGRGAAR
ncbi:MULTISPECIES: hypothetical protein [Bradyrhizobium]|uniref:O-antigen ligase domain-containing protein n=2 Tax=Bradyrhizobium ottawaense TaxID=931866 RepID=A0ABV4G0D2_9BRAD|nr:MULTISPECIES: hypothetical protein [Bradyrhizobium]MBR1293782.1 hypothetical protein [Bradyrhizobium ottawaense]WLB49050.1 hypothetical protein QIH93_14090 [Bradyrhizobium ottawaense]WQN86374.1 hypothetical protein U7859_19050 [Bradyrhizobium ottawaense]BBO05397.1 hypothetical protein SG09_47470 [Bradyrhizobium ottawaense]GMO21376.1 hypothetical protein BwSH14_16290 [Bradyrhizobium ottawaense]